VNEEEIKVKYVLPWLEQAGVTLEELRFELSFSLKIGRQSLIVGQPKTRKSSTLGARLDILVQRNGRNLLIVETKADGLQLTDDDRDQAISYARLVHPIAPYAVVTNGMDYKLYDTVTKTQIKPIDIKVSGLEITLPDDAIIEAQSLFLTVSSSNLITFCRSQVTSELRIVKGALTDGRKYVPELHVPRESVLKEVMEFYHSPLPGLIIIGHSGTGKTSEMCWLAEYLLNNEKPILFFNGFALETGLLEGIASEFSWTFNGSDQPIQIVKRIAKLAGSERLTVIVDAIDEWMYTSREQHLGALLRAAEHNNVKFILSCKTSAVEQFISARGNRTNFDILSRKLKIGAFSDREFHYAIDNYRNAYQFFGNFEDTVLDEARSNPFLLRVLFDVAKNSNLKHLTFSSAEFFETYFRRSIGRTANQRQAENTLKAIAGLLYEQNSDWIAEDEVRKSLELRITESIMEELFEYGILFRNENQTGMVAIGFYFQQLRDYIIAFKVRLFESLSQQQLEDEFRQVIRIGSRVDVFTLYYRLASTERKSVLDQELRKNATSYLHQYISLIERHFPALRGTFKPETLGRIGFIGEIVLSQRRLGSYGFRQLSEIDDEVHFVPVEQILGNSNLPYLDGANQLHLSGSARGFRDGIDTVTEVFDFELIPQLERFVKEGMLNESKCPEMMEEYIIETVKCNNAIFRDLLEADEWSIEYPLILDDILKALSRYKLLRHYRDELILIKRQSGEVKERWDGSIVSYSAKLTPEDEQQILQTVEMAETSGIMPAFRARYVDLDRLERSLTKAINWLASFKTEIDEPLFNGENKLKSDLKRGHPIPDIDAKRYLVWLYSTFLRNYKSIIESNFPTLKHHFNLYSKLPVSVYLVLEKSILRHPGVSRTPLDIYLLEAKSNISEVKILDVDLVRCETDSRSFTSGDLEFRPFTETKSSFEGVFNGFRSVTVDIFQGMPLRRLVYQTLADELKAVKNAFRLEYKNTDST
jgi:hypothetical protein